jgi:hypothetical protein
LPGATLFRSGRTVPPARFALDLSKIEAGKLELNPQTVQLAPLIEEVIGTARLAEQNKNRLLVEAQENLGTLTVDPMRLRQILVNLLRWLCTPEDTMTSTLSRRMSISTSSLFVSALDDHILLYTLLASRRPSRPRAFIVEPLVIWGV